MSIKAHSNVLSDDIPMDIGYVFLKENSTRADSIGYYHNVILEEIARSGKSYVSDEGEIDYQTLLSDCVVFAKSMVSKLTCKIQNPIRICQKV